MAQPAAAVQKELPSISATGENIQTRHELTPEERKFHQSVEAELGPRAREVYRNVHTFVEKSTAKVARDTPRPDRYKDQKEWQQRVAGMLGDMRKRGLVVSRPKEKSRGELLWLKTTQRLLTPQTSHKAKKGDFSGYRGGGTKNKELVEAHQELSTLENNLRATLEQVEKVRVTLQNLDAWEKDLTRRAEKIRSAAARAAETMIDLG